MKKQELINLRNAMMNTPGDIFNGTSDSPARENRLINSFDALHDKLSEASFEGIAGLTLDEIWKDCWDGSGNSHLPEAKYSHDMEYIERVLALLKDKE